MVRNPRIHLSLRRIKLLKRPLSPEKTSVTGAKIGKEKEAEIVIARRKKIGERTKVMIKIEVGTRRGPAREVMIARTRTKSLKRSSKIGTKTKDTEDLEADPGHMIMIVVASNLFLQVIGLGDTTSWQARGVNQLILTSNLLLIVITIRQVRAARQTTSC